LDIWNLTFVFIGNYLFGDDRIRREMHFEICKLRLTYSHKTEVKKQMLNLKISAQS